MKYSRRQLLAMTGAAAVGAIAARPHSVLAAASYEDRVLSKKPVAFWRFAENGSRIAADSSGNGHQGTYHGNVTFAEHRGSEPAIGLDALRAYVEVPNSEAFSQPASGQGLTVEVWLRPDTLVFPGQTEQHYIHWLGKGEGGAFEWGLRFYSKDSPSRPNRISAYIWNNAAPAGASNEGAGAYFQDVLQAGEWIHVVACYDPGDASDSLAGVSIFKNGEFRAGPRKSRAARYAGYDIHPQPGNAPLRFGTRDLESFLRGGIADVAIYPRVLSSGEIADNYTEG